MSQRFFRASVTVTWILVASLAARSETAAHDWPQWRGPSRDGRVEGPTWPESLGEGSLSRIWRVPLGPSYSGPIVTADRVFTTETENEKHEVVRALDRSTGKELWSTRWAGSLKVPFFARANGDWIRSTPAYDGQSLYVGGMRDLLVCLDAATGAERWRFDFVANHQAPPPDFGFVCSPLVDGAAVYVQAGGAFAKLDKRTGKEIWRSMADGGGMFGSAFSSPVFAEIGGVRQLVVQTRTKLAGVDPADGKVLWTQDAPAFRGMNILTPTVHRDGVFTSAYGSRSFFYQLTKGSGGFEPRQTWNNKTQGYMSSPILDGGHVYIHLRNQRVACIDLETGKEKWISKQRFGQYWSMVAQKDKILGLDELGILYLMRANPDQFELLGSVKLSDEPTWAHLAVSGDELFVRELNALAAYRWTGR